MARIVALIPARMGSSRFPGKPLAPLRGLPMIEHVFRRVSMCEALEAIYVATCDAELRAVVEGFGGAARHKLKSAAECLIRGAFYELRAAQRVSSAWPSHLVTSRRLSMLTSWPIGYSR